MEEKPKYRDIKAGDPDAPARYEKLGKKFPNMIIRVYDEDLTGEELEELENEFWRDVQDLGNPQD